MSAAPSVHHRQIDTLYSDHHRWLQGWLGRKLGNPCDAADLAQDTFMRLLAARQPERIVQPRAYLTRIAQNILVNWYQRQALERAYLEALALLPEAQAPSAEHRLIILETLHEIDAMLDALKPQARRAFLLSQIDGMKYEDIARELGVSLVTVKRYMQQGFRGCLALME
ncbi:sigma-70 family RNA polymerase sigma factor [Variovorax sp. LT1R16]|uniref:sigma-70 family RNA polymerase sigma factor n=1 Tax=Variovorax sp. LT1R16 TaxID=3443728 RepID=UPI003F463D2F